MTTGPRASERALVGLTALLLVLAGAACRQTVLLDSQETAPDGDGGRGGAGGGEVTDGGRLDGGRFDGPRPNGFCSGGQIVSLIATPRWPDLVFTVDRSSAMQSAFGDGTRLGVSQQAVRGLIQRYKSVVHFGYEEFPSTTSNCAGSMGCCAGDVTPPAPNTQTAIDKVMHRCDNNNGSPSCLQSQRPFENALEKCSSSFTTFPNNFGGRYLIALLGGEPSCQDSDPTVSPCEEAARTLTLLSRLSVGTAIFGVGAETANLDCLDKLATAGGLGIPATMPYYHLTRSPAELGAALDALVKTIAQEACHIDIRTPPTDPTLVSVLFNSTPVDIDSTNGWTFDQDSTVSLTLHGAACEQLVTNSTRLEVISGCTSPHH